MERDGEVSPLAVIDAKPLAVVVSEVELGSVAMQMHLADVEVATVNAALEDREEVLDGVRVPEVGADIFFGAVVDGAVTGEPLADLGIDRTFVGHEVGGRIHLSGDDGAEGCGSDVR